MTAEWVKTSREAGHTPVPRNAFYEPIKVWESSPAIAETEEGLSMLRDLVHAKISFKELAQQTGLGEKALHRMLSRRGNPTTRNLFAMTKAICESLSSKPCVAVGGHS